jgi:hypothetical protein
MLRLAELAARECDGKDALSVPVLIAAKRQRRLEVKMREIGSSVGTCRQLRLDDGQAGGYGRGAAHRSRPGLIQRQSVNADGLRQ